MPGTPALEHVGVVLVLLEYRIVEQVVRQAGPILQVVDAADALEAQVVDGQATRGATAGMVVGLFFPPWGLLLGPFVGALLGELLTHATAGKALRVALLSFLAFLLTTGFKLLYGVAVLIMMW